MSGIPQDSRSPFRQQRWVEALNNTQSDLDSFSLVAITDATRDLTTGQTVLTVDLPSTTTHVALLCCTGPQSIKAGKKGMVTLDFPCYVQYDTANTPANGEQWGHTNASVKIAKNHQGFRICGDPDGNIVRVERDTDASLIRFELTADLDRNSTATAKLLDIDWTDTGATITVRDPFTTPGCWQAYTGYKGFAVLGASGIYDVVWMERRALIVYFTLTQDTNTSSGTTCTFTSYFQQGDKLPSTTGSPPGTTGLVYDHQELYPKAKNGAKGIAVWNDDRKRYEVVVCQQMGTLFWAKAGENFCPDAETVALATVSGHKIQVIQHSPFNQLPSTEPTSAENWRDPDKGLAGMENDWMLLAYDATRDKYTVVQVTPHEFKNYCEWRVVCNQDADVAPKLQARYIKFYAYKCDPELCEEKNNWEDVGDIGTKVTNVTAVYWDGLCLTMDQQVQYVLCEYDPSNSNIDCPVECEES